MSESIKLNIGSGIICYEGFINIDNVQLYDNQGKEIVDIVLDIEKDKLPFEDDSIDEIRAESILEHLGDGLIFCLNECHRVLKPTGILKGNVPPPFSEGSIRDITHKRQFNKASFSYLAGINPRFPNQPSHPKYANYGVKPWYAIYVTDDIKFALRPRKTTEYNKKFESEIL